jgi:phage regulator Rha-like protein
MTEPLSIVSLVNGQPVTTTTAIAEGAKVEHASVIKLVRTYQSDFEEFGRVGFEIEPFKTAGGMQSREIAILNEQQATLLFTFMKNTAIVRAFKKRLVKAFFVLAKQSSPGAHAFLPAVQAETLLLQSAASMLRLSETSILRGLHQIASNHGIRSNYLPAYSDEQLVRPLTALLKEHGSTLTAARVNPILVGLGYLEQLSRPSRKKLPEGKSEPEMRHFWSVTVAGLKYGKNETAPQNPRETQPLWYVDRFGELLGEIEAYRPALHLVPTQPQEAAR